MQRNIRGPRSALTDYLASQNISARQIRANHEARLRAAAADQAAASSSAAQNVEPAEAPETAENDEDDAESLVTTSTRQATTRKRKSAAAATEKMKSAKLSKLRKSRRNDPDNDSDEDALERSAGPMPGQLANCEECHKRFTVTAYSRAGPEGGLLCPQCSMKLTKEENAARNASKKGKQKATGVPIKRERRKIQSLILDGQIGVKTLMTLCVEMLANNIHLADDLGDLPLPAIDRIARQLSKRRLMGPNTLNLFLQPQTQDIMIYDGGRLSSNDYMRIFQVCSSLKVLKLRNAIQFKDEVMEYLIGRHIALESFYISGANLITDEFWEKYLKAKGQSLTSLRVYFTDRYFGDKTIKSLSSYCPSLNRLKIYHNQAVTDKGIGHIAQLPQLQHLGLRLVNQTQTMPYVDVVQKLGNQLYTLSIRDVPQVDDRLLDAIHDHCTRLVKLRITNSEAMTDAGFARLFKDWKNKPLQMVDLELCRHVDSSNPRLNQHMVGFCSAGFRALMKHSGKHLRKLNIHGCRHVSGEAFEDVFAVGQVYPDLLDMEISFCEEVTDLIVGLIFKSCPRLKRLNVFGCMKVKDVRVPRGKILVGVPNAMGMIIEGTED
ncbi:RNI-like protein [Daldinia bambusicola]|nr:RNI-like protein [Daldinia bambusicola]